MRYYALATDYDGTIATHGQVGLETVQALRQLKASGRTLLLVTGRELSDLFSVFPQPDLFDLIVAENGALLYDPDTKETRVLAEAPPERFVEALRERGISPLSRGQVIVATVEPFETIVLQVIHELGLEMQVIFNKGSVMVLPSGVNKATGLKAALKKLGLSHHNVVGVGDAENDHAFLEFCGCSVAVSNALPALKERVDLVTRQDHGAGVSELIAQILGDDLRSAAPRLTRHDILLGTSADRGELRLSPTGTNLLVVGNSTEVRAFTAGWVENLIQARFQVCLLDPEGDSFPAEKAVMFGGSYRAPAVDTVLHALDQPQDNVLVHLSGVTLANRVPFVQQLLRAVTDLQQHTGRPHWIAFGEAHHLGPGISPSLAEGEGAQPGSVLISTSEPQSLAPRDLARVQMVVAVGPDAAGALGTVSAVLRRPPPSQPPSSLDGSGLLWIVADDAVIPFQPTFGSTPDGGRPERGRTSVLAESY